MMNKIVNVMIVCVLSLVLFACSNEPSEETLVTEGASLTEAIDEFNDLSDNYLYKLEIHQTNGEDWFVYKLAKFYEGDIYLQSMAYHFNAGWQNKDLILTNYSDVSDIGYHLYDMHADGSFRHYYKFKYVSTDEDFQKLYMDSDDDENPELVFDYSIFELGMFEHTYDDQVEEISNRWYITDDYLNDETFKQSLSDSFYMHADVEQMRLNFLYLTVENNIVTQIEFGYWGGYDDQQSYYYTIVIERDNYTFDIGALSAGFIYYEDNMD